MTRQDLASLFPAVAPAPVVVSDKRAEALGVARALGLPSAQDESWRWSGLAGRLSELFSGEPQETRQEESPEATGEEAGIVFRGKNVQLPSPVAPSVAGVALEKREVCAPFIRLAQDARAGEANPFPLVAAGLAEGSLLLEVPSGQRVEEAVNITLTNSGAPTHAACLVRLGDNATLDLIWRVTPALGVSAGSALINYGLAVEAGAGARLRLLLLEEELPEAFVGGGMVLSLGARAEVQVLRCGNGQKFSRLELDARLEGRGSRLHFRGAEALSDSKDGKGQHSETILRVRHQAPESRSQLLCKTAVGHNGDHIFQGRAEIAEGAKEVEAAMTSKALLLSDSAKSRNKPELEICHDDVACSHGVAVSDLQPETLFYLRSRGLDETSARRAVVRGFLRDAVQNEAQEPDSFMQKAEEALENSLSRFVSGRGV